MTKPANTASIEKATNKSWQQWIDELEENGAKELSHTELAKKLYGQLYGRIENPEWWAQGITVAYEQHIGKRIPGQLANGLFELAVSKTVATSRSNCFKQVEKWFENQSKLNGSKFIRPRSTETPNRSNWRCDFSDGSKFAATVEGDNKTSKLILSHTSLPSKQEADEWKSFWRNVADKLAAL